MAKSGSAVGVHTARVAGVRDEPAALTRQLVAGFLRTHWGIEAVKLEYAPVGFGSYHWIGADGAGPRWFVTADVLSPAGSWLGPSPEHILAALTAATAACGELVDRGYEFVVAPLPDRTGALVRQVLPGWVMHLYPYLAGWSSGHGDWRDATEHVRIAELIGRLHAAQPPAVLRRWDFTVPGRDQLAAALADLATPWTSGPYAERTRDLLATARTDILALLDRYDALAAEIAASPDPWVVSHGEPHSGNVVRTDHGMRLIDWDTVLLAPRERDLTTVLDGADPATALIAYQRHAGPHAPRPAALELFDRWWALAEICGYVGLFRGPHGDTADAAESWRNLCHYTPGAKTPDPAAS